MEHLDRAIQRPHFSGVLSLWVWPDEGKEGGKEIGIAEVQRLRQRTRALGYRARMSCGIQTGGQS